MRGWFGLKSFQKVITCALVVLGIKRNIGPLLALQICLSFWLSLPEYPYEQIAPIVIPFFPYTFFSSLVGPLIFSLMLDSEANALNFASGLLTPSPPSTSSSVPNASMSPQPAQKRPQAVGGQKAPSPPAECKQAPEPADDSIDPENEVRGAKLLAIHLAICLCTFLVGLVSRHAMAVLHVVIPLISVRRTSV